MCLTDRRGLKAGFMLVPLFGLQLLLTIYRPDIDAHGARQYEYITIAVTNSQVGVQFAARWEILWKIYIIA